MIVARSRFPVQSGLQIRHVGDGVRMDVGRSPAGGSQFDGSLCGRRSCRKPRGRQRAGADVRGRVGVAISRSPARGPQLNGSLGGGRGGGQPRGRQRAGADVRGRVGVAVSGGPARSPQLNGSLGGGRGGGQPGCGDGPGGDISRPVRVARSRFPVQRGLQVRNIRDGMAVDGRCRARLGVSHAVGVVGVPGMRPQLSLQRPGELPVLRGHVPGIREHTVRARQGRHLLRRELIGDRRRHLIHRLERRAVCVPLGQRRLPVRHGGRHPGIAEVDPRGPVVHDDAGAGFRVTCCDDVVRQMGKHAAVALGGRPEAVNGAPEQRVRPRPVPRLRTIKGHISVRHRQHTGNQVHRPPIHRPGLCLPGDGIMLRGITQACKRPDDLPVRKLIGDSRFQRVHRLEGSPGLRP